MATPILPEALREDIEELFRKGYTREAVFKFVRNEAQKNVDSDEQLNRCIIGIEQDKIVDWEKRLIRQEIEHTRYNLTA